MSNPGTDRPARHAVYRCRVQAILTAIVLATAPPASMASFGTPTYANLPAQMPPAPSTASQAGACNPLLVDDFVAAASADLRVIFWWGSAAQDARWRVALFDHEPTAATGACGSSDPGIDDAIYADALANFNTTAYPIDDGPPGVFRYFVGTTSGPVLQAGQRYWLTVANYGPDWYWAQALGDPVVGAKQDGARGRCLGGPSSCGPWVDVGTDLAFMVTVPEPGILALLSAALLALGLGRRHRLSTRP